MNALFAANLGLLATVLVWGTPIPLLHDLLQRWDPVAMAWLRYFCPLPVLLLLLRLTEPAVFARGRFVPPGLTPLRWFLLSTCGMGGFAVLFQTALQTGDPITVAIFGAASPLVAALVNWIGFGVRPLAGLLVALPLAFAGGVLAGVDFSDASFRPALRGGEPLMLLAIACWSWYSIVAQRWMVGASQLRITTISVLPTVFVMGLVYWVAYLLGWAAPLPAAPSAGDLGLIAWISISSIALGVLTWNYGVSRLGIVVASMFLNLIPLVAILTAMALGHEPRPEQFLGGILVVAAVLQAQLRSWRRQRASS